MSAHSEGTPTWSHRLREDWCSLTDRSRAGFLAVFSAVIFAAVNWHNYMVDFVPLSLIPVSLWREGTVQLDAFRPYYESLPEKQRYTFTEVNGHLYSIKPVFVSLLAAPFFSPPVLAGVPAENVDFWIGWGRLVAAGLTGVAVGLCYLIARRWGSHGAALGFTLLIAFGTCIWTVVGQTLTYHAGAFLCTAGLVLALHDFPLSTRRAALAGFLAGAAVVMRLTPLVLLLPVGLYLCMPGRMKSFTAWLAALGGIILLPLANALLNQAVFGHWYKTGYDEEMGKWVGVADPTLWVQGMFGIALAPNAGLIPQSPFLVLAAIGGWVVWTARDVKDRGLLRSYTLGIVGYASLFCLWHDWWGGLTFASRMLAEAYPLFLPLILVGWNRVSRYPFALPLVVAAGTWSVLYQVIGVATFDPICELAPRDWEWDLSRHFYVLYVQQFGWVAFLQAVGRTLSVLAAIAVVACVVLHRLSMPQAQKSTSDG